ncbi:MAG TPA: hypothetical protein VGI92_06710 [Gemmatimonadales bacterium]|jgi:dTDP-glucose pyrophosphorylase
MTVSSPTLVVLAAGLGSRYRGLKQLEAVGPGGATLMDYAVYDAQRSGFGDAVFIIRPDMEELFEAMVRSRIGARFPVRTVFQRKDDLPPGVALPANRTKPWGTGQAVLAAARQLTGPFAVVNADDFYGPEAYAAIGKFLAAPESGNTPGWAVVGYHLRDTLSASGGVNRAVCRTSGGRLASLEEVIDIVPSGDRYTGRGRNGHLALTGEMLVSMNMWGFTAELRDLLERGFADFLRSADLDRAEYLLPEAVQTAIQGGRAQVTVLDAGARWIGMTHPEDRARVEQALAAMVAEGLYPERLW